MAPLATAYVRLRTDSTVLAADATRDAAKAGEIAGAEMGTRMTHGLSRTFKAAVGIGAATGLVELGKKVFELADQFEGARARVEQNTENIGASFTALQKPLGGLDDRMAKLGFTMTDTENSFAQLVTATRSPAKALNDVGLAADIARGRHIGLDQATQILMRVETGHVAMLGRLGIATRDASGHMFTQEQALQALAQAYGGNAQRFAGTMAGKQQALRAEFQKSAMEISVALLPALVDLAGFVQHEVVPPIEAAAHWFERNRRVIEPLVAIIGGATLAWKLYSAATKAAAAANLAFGGSAAAAEAGAAGTAAAAGGRGKLFGFGTVLAGGAAAYGGSKLGGNLGSDISAAGTGAIIGGVIGGPVGAGVGALALGGFTAGKNLGTDIHQSLFGHSDPNSDANVMAKLGPAAKKLVGAYGSVDAALEGLKAANQGNLALQQAMAGAFTKTGVAAVRSADQIEASAHKALDLTAAQDSLRQAMHAVAQSAADNGRALSGNSDAALANRDAVRNQVTAMFGLLDLMKTQGASASARATELQLLTNAIETNAIKVYGDRDAVDKLLHSLGLIPGAVDIAATALASLPGAAQSAINNDRITAGSMHQLNTAIDTVKATANKQGKDVAKAFSDGYSPIVTKATKDTANKAAEAFNKLKDRMTSDLQTIRDAVNSTQSSVAGFAAFSTTGTDALGASGANSDFIGQKRAAAQRLEQFAHLYGQLTRSGLNPDDLHEFVGLGPAAIPAMQALLAAGKAGIRTENRLDQRIQRASGQVATLDAGSQNAGLIHKDLTTLPAKLGREFAKGLKNVHVSVSLRETDRKNGIAVVTSP